MTDSKRVNNGSKVLIPRFTKQSRDKDKKSIKPSAQLLPEDSEDLDLLPKIENWNNDMANSIPSKMSKRAASSGKQTLL